MDRDCTATEACTHHNLHCGYPDCAWGRAQSAKNTAATLGTEEKLNIALAALEDIAQYTGEGPTTTPWRDIVRSISQHANAALNKIS